MANNRLVRRWGFGPTLVAFAFVPGIAIILLSLATSGTAVPVLAGSLALAGFAEAVCNVNQITLRQSVTPTPMLGRMNATVRFVIWGSIPLGTFLGGLLGQTIGLRRTLWIAGTGNILAGLPLPLSRVRNLRSLTDAGPGIASRAVVPGALSGPVASQPGAPMS